MATRGIGSRRSPSGTRTTSSRAWASIGIRRRAERACSAGDGRRQVRPPRRLRADARLRVPQPRAEHRQLVPVRRGDRSERSAGAFAAADDRSADDESEPLRCARWWRTTSDRRMRPVQPGDAARADRTWPARRLRRHARPRPLPDVDGNPTPEFSRAPVQRVDPARGVIRLRANEATPTITRCR